MKVLVTGANGQLGRELCGMLDTGHAQIGPVPRVYEGAQVVAAGSAELDICDESAVETLVGEGSFDLVVNCAAYTDVDGCERDEARAFAANAAGPANLARACAKSGAKLVHVSTDYVFAGDDPRPRTEADPTGPVSVYGRSKLEGERLVARECPRHFVVRTAWLYATQGKNFVATMRSLGQRRSQVSVVNDQFGNPTSANDLAYHILKLALTSDYGLYHCTGTGVASWFELACAVMELSGLACEVVPVTSEQYRAMNPAAAPRPHFSALENARLARTAGDEMRPWREALADHIAILQKMGG